ncbi:MAG TPA: PAS domain-containing protein [Candidatus Limnocylindrales bacterium]|jgi:PAS domain-containing protein
MILRLWRAPILLGMEAPFLDRLRALAPGLQDAAEPTDFTYGFRHEAGQTTFLAVSAWTDIAAVATATTRDLMGTIDPVGLEVMTESSGPETFERLPPVSDRLADADGRILGVVTATVLPGHEAVAQSMIDRSASAAISAGALAAHVGRRLEHELVSVAIVVVWPKRDDMTRFVRSRDLPALDPAFTAHLSAWRFETYNVVAPERLIVPAEGPAVLIVDMDGRYVEATPGVEAVLGVPGELLHGRSILELAHDDIDRADLRRRLLETGVSHGVIDIARPDGRRARVRYRSVADVPAPGLRASVLTAPADPDDPRPTAEIVIEALGLVATGADGETAGRPARFAATAESPA